MKLHIHYGKLPLHYPIGIEIENFSVFKECQRYIYCISEEKKPLHHLRNPNGRDGKPDLRRDAPSPGGAKEEIEEDQEREEEDSERGQRRLRQQREREGKETGVDDEQSPGSTPGLVVEGRLLGKRSRSSSPMSKSPCLLAYAPDGPVLYSINFSENSTSDYPKSSLWSHKKGNFCRRCCVDLFGDQDNNDELGLRELIPYKTKSRWTLNCTISVALGSAVYVLGGVFVVEDPKKKKRWVYSRDVFRFDNDRPRAGWTRCLDMLNGRYQGKAVAVKGKIYVFGGNDIEHAPHPWGEVGAYLVMPFPLPIRL
ncbi:hypothetical protein RHGRI_037957 [Rhododendron griersonianum]|uniref:F-box/kelch-repeat protein n=1 Tax=Rhododendron griersonianum TaxID=479676 RepID=A0AAV6HWJ7_9ERIC|nr:hypothetical protein RHGRI_037957 [Rhododendron griersonianum]